MSGQLAPKSKPCVRMAMACSTVSMTVLATKLTLSVASLYASLTASNILPATASSSSRTSEPAHLDKQAPVIGSDNSYDSTNPVAIPSGKTAP